MKDYLQCIWKIEFFSTIHVINYIKKLLYSRRLKIIYLINSVIYFIERRKLWTININAIITKKNTKSISFFKLKKKIFWLCLFFLRKFVFDSLEHSLVTIMIIFNLSFWEIWKTDLWFKKNSFESFWITKKSSLSSELWRTLNNKVTTYSDHINT